jgi:hypothetical protein
MPATFNALAAVIAHTQLAGFSTDSFGIPNDMVGMLLNSVTPKPGRTKKSKADRFGFEGVLEWHINPVYTLEVDGSDYFKTGNKFANKHPGEAISRADVANYVPGLRHGFPDSGYFVFEEVTQAAAAAELHTNKFTLALKWMHDGSVQVLTPSNAV